MNKKELKKIISEVVAEESALLVRPFRPLHEGGFSRLRQIMLGQVPSIQTAAILTAENPAGGPGKGKASPGDNARAMRALKQRLKHMNLNPMSNRVLGYTPLKGSFGEKENSLFIPNLSREEAIALGQQFQQTAVIWGEAEGDDKPAFKWEYITLLDDDGTPLAQPRVDDTKSVSMSGTDVQSRDDFYSEKAGRKFLIPFFADDVEEEVNPESLQESMTISPSARTLLESIDKRVALSCRADTPGRTRWHCRGLIKKDLKRVLDMLNGD